MAISHLPEPHPTDPVVHQLTRIYAEAYEQTILDLQRAVARGLSTEFKATLLLNLSRRLAELRTYTLAWAFGPIDPATGTRLLTQSALYAAVAKADRETLKQLADIGVRVEVPPPDAITPSFTMLHHDAIRVVAENLVRSLNQTIETFDRSVRGFIGRAENDLFRRAGLEAAADKFARGQTLRQARKALQEELATQGIPAFVDSRGRSWNLRSYADMHIRTVTREATSEATLRRVQWAGHDYLIATRHYPTCPICAVRQGRVYCISGNDPRFPALRTVGNTPWHPNCGHSLVPWSEAYEPNLEAVIARSQQPFDVDPRSQREIELYERSQKIRREQALKRRLTLQMQAPGLSEEERERLRRRRAAANRRLIELNRAQREALPGWR